MSEYTPDFERVRKQWAYGQAGDRVHRTQEYLDQFDRFIAQVKRDAARAALDGLAGDYTRTLDLGLVARVTKHIDTHYPEDVTP